MTQVRAMTRFVRFEVEATVEGRTVARGTLTGAAMDVSVPGWLREPV